MEDLECYRYLKNQLGLRELSQKICNREVKSFRCCFEIKGENYCNEFLDLVRTCYLNRGVRVKKPDEV